MKNITTQFNWIIGLISFLALFLVFQSIIQIRLSDEGRATSEKLLHKGIPANDLFIEVQDHVLNMRISATGVVFGTDPAAINAKNEERLAYAAETLRHLEQLKELQLDIEGIDATFSSLEAGISSFQGIMDRVKESMDKDDFMAATELLDQQLPSVTEQISSNLQQLQQQLTQSTVLLSEANRDSSIRANIYSEVFSAGAIGLSVLLAGFCIHLSRKISRSLLEVIHELNNSSQRIKSSADSLTVSSQQLAEGASEQAATLEETSASVEEMSSMIQRDTDVARETNQEAKQTSEAAHNGVKIMGELRVGVEHVSSSAKEMEAAIQDIKTSSDSISKIIKTIDEIAFQTNILALNAAVEAARAGQAGAGFAVVADEVRSLARRAAEAAQETSGMIETSIERSDRGVRVNEQVNRNLQVVLERAQEVENSLSRIVTFAGKTSESMDNLEASAMEQAEGIGQINTAVLQVNEVTQQNAVGAEKAAHTSVDMNAQADMLLKVVESLTRLVKSSGQKATSPSKDKPVPKAPTKNPQPARSNGTGDIKFDLDEPVEAGRHSPSAGLKTIFPARW